MAKSNISYDGTTPITPHEYKDVWQKAFDHFNRELFDGELPDAMIVFARNAHSLGHYASKRYLSRSGGFTKDEISLNPDGYKDRPDKAIAGTFVQQMVSHWQEHHGHHKPAHAGYHNKEWAKKMKATLSVVNRQARRQRVRPARIALHHCQWGLLLFIRSTSRDGLDADARISAARGIKKEG